MIVPHRYVLSPLATRVDRPIAEPVARALEVLEPRVPPVLWLAARGYMEKEPRRAQARAAAVCEFLAWADSTKHELGNLDSVVRALEAWGPAAESPLETELRGRVTRALLRGLAVVHPREHVPLLTPQRPAHGRRLSAPECQMVFASLERRFDGSRDGLVARRDALLLGIATLPLVRREHIRILRWSDLQDADSMLLLTGRAQSLPGALTAYVRGFREGLAAFGVDVVGDDALCPALGQPVLFSWTQSTRPLLRPLGTTSIHRVVRDRLADARLVAPGERPSLGWLRRDGATESPASVFPARAVEEPRVPMRRRTGSGRQSTGTRTPTATRSATCDTANG